MQIKCHACGNAHSLADDVFGNQDVYWLNCTACGQAIRVVSPILRTLRLDTTAQVAAPVTAELSAEGIELRLPAGWQISLEVVEGEEKGAAYPLGKPRVLIGRANADINVNDPTVSRLHCALEISDQGVLVRDLGSSNGTFVADQPVVLAPLGHGSTFRIGMHVFRLVIAPLPS